MSGISTETLINGRIVNTQVGGINQGATALAGLNVTWGRKGVLDQPEATTLSLALALPEDQAAQLIEEVTQGSPILVRSRLDAIPADRAVIKDARLLKATGATATGTTTRTLVASVPSPSKITALTPPAAASTDPAAWDTIPRIARGSQWKLSQSVGVPMMGGTVELHAAYYTGPADSAPIIDPKVLATLTSPSSASTRTLTATITADPSRVGLWMGIALVFTAPGSEWSAYTAKAWSAVTATWSGQATYAVSAQTLTLLGAGTYESTVFEGRISDAIAAWDKSLKRPVLSIAATDFWVDTANQRIGDDPWPEETATARVSRILALSPLNVGAVIDPAPAALRLARVDVDSQAVQGLLESVSVSTGAVCWPTTHDTIGPYLYLEDTAIRKALYKLTVPATGDAYLEVKASDAIAIPAQVLQRDPVKVVKNPGGAASIATTRWATVTTGDDGKLDREDHEVTVSDPALLTSLGYRAISRSTDLVTASDAHALAVKTLALAGPAGFMLTGLTWDTDLPGTDPQKVMSTLDSSRRIGLPVVLTDLPEWVPGTPAIPAYLEGGSYTLTGGRWHLDLTASKAAYPADSISWAKAPTELTWTKTAALTWNDIAIATI